MLKGKTILVVDDEPDLRDLLSEELQLAGGKVLTAENGLQALEVISKNVIDLVISDLRMNNGDGLTIINGVEKMNSPKPKVVILTGYMDDDDAMVSKKAHAVLQKPIKWQNLIEIVGQAIAKEK